MQYPYAATITSTATVSVRGSADTSLVFLTSKTFSTESWIVYPRTDAIDTTGQVIGNTTDYPPVRFPLVNEYVNLSIAGATSAGVAGTINVFVEGA